MKNEMNNCPICEEGSLHEHIEQEVIEYKGQEGTISLYFSECDMCGSEQANAEQTRKNKRAMMAFKKEVNGLLTGQQVKEFREHWGISQKQAANIFGGGPVAFSKYEADDVAQSEPMDKLLRVAKANHATFLWLAEKAGEHDLCKREMNNQFVLMKRNRDTVVTSIREASEYTEPQRIDHTWPLVDTDTDGFLQEAIG